MQFDQISLMLPTITSHETVLVREWLTEDAQRRSQWSRKAQDLVLQIGMDEAAHHLSCLLCDQVMDELDCAQGLGQTLVEAAIKRINFFELAIGLLKPYDASGYFDPAPHECTDEDSTAHRTMQH